MEAADEVGRGKADVIEDEGMVVWDPPAEMAEVGSLCFVLVLGPRRNDERSGSKSHNRH